MPWPDGKPFVAETLQAQKARIAELEAFKAEALARLHRLSMALTRIECETPDDWIRNIARDTLYQKTPSQ